MMSVETALHNGFCLFYHDSVDPSTLIPVQTLQGSIQHVNRCIQSLGNKISEWPWGDQDEAARLVRVNWIYQRLHCESIRKPLLVDKQFNVVCGDTRLMSLMLLDHPPPVSVVVACWANEANKFSGWTNIRSDHDLIQAAKFDQDAQVLIECNQQGITWLEIGDSTTAHHLHDHDQRVQMLEKYLTQHHIAKLSVEWCKHSVAWQNFL